MASVNKLAPFTTSSNTGKEPTSAMRSPNITINRRLNSKESSDTSDRHFSSCSPRTRPTLAGPPLISTPVTSAMASSPRPKVSLGRDVDNFSEGLESIIGDTHIQMRPENSSMSASPLCKPSFESSASLAIVQRKVHSTTTERQKMNCNRGKARYSKLELRQRGHSSYHWLPTPRPTGLAPVGFSGISYPQLLLPVTKAKDKLVHFESDNETEREQNFISSPAKHLVSQTWSSIGLESEILKNLKSLTLDDSSVHRRRTWPSESKDTSIISTIRTRLTSRRVCPKQTETPATITLRRASERPNNRKSRPTQTASTVSSNVSGAPRTWKSIPPASSLRVYLITSQDIDYVIGLIQSTFRHQGCQVHQTESFNDPRPCLGSKAGSKSSGKTSIVSTGCLPPQTNVAADVAMTFIEIHGDSKSISPQDAPGMSTDSAENISTVSRVLSHGSLHEIIWNNKGMPESLCSYLRTSPSSNTSSQSRESRSPSIYFTGENSCDNLNQLGSVSDCIPKMIHDNQWLPAKPKLFSWPWNEMHDELSIKISNSRKDSQSISTANSSPHIRSSSPSSNGKSEDVFSFPPLPQRTQTSDWISPLPDMLAQSTNPGSQTLYSLGIDATTGTNQSWIDATNGVNSNKIDSSQVPESERTIPSSKRAKSTVMPHPQALPRICETTKIGSSIGSSSGARRKSSNRLQHVGVDEHVGEPSRGGKLWKKPRKDSGYPRNIHYSSDEDSSENSEQIHPTRGGSSLQETVQQRNRRELIDEKAPQLVKIDPAGIYVALTGTVKKTKPHDIEHGVNERVDSRKGSQSLDVDWIG